MNLSPEAQRAVETAQKLMRLAGKNTNENEAASATAKAMELLAAHNLDVSIIEQGGGEKSKRSDEKLSGGLYLYQRELWEAVASLNFCLYWNQYTYDAEKPNKKRMSGKGGYRFQHRLVGRQVNVVSTRNMAEYLEQTIERLTRERLKGDGSQFFTRWAISYREGIAAEVITKIYAERQHLLDEEQRRLRKAREAAAQATKGDASTATALTIASLAQSERDENVDFLYGEGYSAKRRAERAEDARLQKEADEEYARWAAANPEEAAAAEAEARKARRSSWNSGTARDRREDRMDYSAYWGGREAGKTVSLNPQTEGTGKAKRLK